MIPVNYTASVREKFYCANIVFRSESPRESKEFFDNVYASKLVRENYHNYHGHRRVHRLKMSCTQSENE